jgi:hypothetical protein
MRYGAHPKPVGIFDRPKNMTLALLGIGLAGLGFARRRALN